MALDASIPLSGRPVAMPELDLNKTFLTLGQLRALQAQAGLYQAQAAVQAQNLSELQRRQGQALDLRTFLRSGGQTLPPGMAQPQPLRALHAPMVAQPEQPPFSSNEPAPGPGTTEPAGAPGEPGAAPGQPQPDRLGKVPGMPDVMDPEYRRTLLAIDPEGAPGYITTALANESASLKAEGEHLGLRQAQLEDRLRPLNTLSPDDPQFQNKWRAFYLQLSSLLPPQVMAMIPETGSAQAIDQVGRLGMGMLANMEQRRQDYNAQSQRMQAEGELLRGKAAGPTAQAALTQAGAAVTQAGAALTQAETERLKAMGFDVVATPQGSLVLQRTTGATRGIPAPEAGTVGSQMQTDIAGGIRNSFLSHPTQVQFSQTIQPAYHDLEVMRKGTTGASDLAGMYAFNKIIDPRLGVSPTQVEEIQRLGTLSQKARGELQRLVQTGQRLSPEVRDEVYQAGKAAYESHKRSHQDMVQQTRDYARSQGVRDPETTIPDLSTMGATPPVAPAAPVAPGTAPGTHRLGVQPGGSIVVPRSAIPELAKRWKLTIPQAEQRIKDAGDTISP